MARLGRFAGGIAAAAMLLGVVPAGAASAERPGAVAARDGGDPRQRLEATGSRLFGFSVALTPDGGLALVGAPNTDAAQGAVYVFVRSGGTWNLQQKLQVAHPAELGALRFGSSVSLSSDGRTALIGAQGSNPAIDGEDAAYVFVRGFVGGFSLQQKLVNPEGGLSANAFGASVSLSSDGRTALVGAPNPVTGGGGSAGGASYVFARDLVGGWTLRQTLRAGADGFDAFGSSVALSADSRLALVGAPSAGAGAAYVFARGFAGGFTQQQRLQAADRASGDAFGGSVSVSGDGRTALIGASQKEVGQFQGAAYVFARGVLGGFAQQQKLQAADRAAFDEFGGSVSLSGDARTALIGARGKDGGKGAAYVFARGLVGGFAQRQRLQAADRVDGDFFGWSVTLSSDGSVSMIGAPEISGDRSGSAYVFAGLA